MLIFFSGAGYHRDMTAKEPTPAERRRTRIFIVIFFGAALLLAITTITGTWLRQSEQAGVTQESPAPP